MNIIVLGCGLVGSAIVRDLALESSFNVTAVDVSEGALDRVGGIDKVARLQADLASPDRVRELVAAHDLVIGAVPGFMGYRTVEAAIAAGKNVVDISFFPEDALTLDSVARSQGVTAIVDCGVAPGCGNILFGHVHTLLDRTDRFLCYVGGLPVTRRKPYEYTAVFSPVDVIEEYTRPARYVENGRLVTREALSDIELLDFDGIGTLEAFNSDGLRTLAVTMNAPDMKEKTLRYPGHADLMRVLRDSGFFRTDSINVRGVTLRPLDVTAALLFPKWTLPEGEHDFTVMRVVIEGQREGEILRYTYDLLDRYDSATGITSMARTTGYTCSVAARLVADGVITQKGIVPPEYIGAHAAAYGALMAGLQERNVVFRETIERCGRSAN